MLAKRNLEEMYALHHHRNAKSFKKALQLGCIICIRVWAESGKPEIEGGLKCFLSCRAGGNPGQDLNFDYVIGPYRSASFHIDPCPAGLDATTDSLCDNTGSDKSFAFIAENYRRCLLQHPNCSMKSSPRYLPTRLLDVGRRQDKTIRLVEKTNIEQNATYVTLSHCWGKIVLKKLTTSTATALHHGISIAELPKTFQHAVTVARRMDQRYLWIDSLYVPIDENVPGKF